jgi:hypothetical protein
MGRKRIDLAGFENDSVKVIGQADKKDIQHSSRSVYWKVQCKSCMKISVKTASRISNGMQCRHCFVSNLESQAKDKIEDESKCAWREAQLAADTKDIKWLCKAVGRLKKLERKRLQTSSG